MLHHCAPLLGSKICHAAAHRGASSRPPGPVRTPAVREPMGDRAALERVVLELWGGRPPEGPALADMIVDEEIDFEQLGQLTLPEIREVPPGVRMEVSFTVDYHREPQVRKSGVIDGGVRLLCTFVRVGWWWVVSGEDGEQTGATRAMSGLCPALGQR